MEKLTMNYWDEILKKNPTNISALMHKAFKLFDKMEDEEAIKIYDKVIQLDPTYIDAYIWASECLLFHLVDYKKAEVYLFKALKIDPENAAVHKLLAWVYDYTAESHKYEYHLRKAIEYEPTWIMIRISLIEYLVRIKKYTEAKEQLEEAYKQLNFEFPVPKDEMDEYYESLITGRIYPEDKKTTLDKYKVIIEESLKNGLEKG